MTATLTAPTNGSLVVYNCKRHRRNFPQTVITCPKHGRAGWIRDAEGVLREHVYIDEWDHKGWLSVEEVRIRKDVRREEHNLKHRAYQDFERRPRDLLQISGGWEAP